jgi:glycosyltransferase involved in cell wall biosynthesis
MPDRVAIVSSSYPAGPGDPSGHFVAAEAEELARAGHDVLVVTTCGASPTRADVAHEDGVRVLRLWSGRAAGFPGIVARLRARPWQAAALALWAVSAERALRERGPFRRIVAHWLLPCGFPIASRAARGAELEIVAHGSDARLCAALPAPLRRALAARLVRHSAQLRCSSHAVREQLERALSLAPESLAVRAPRLDLRETPDRARARARLSIPVGDRLAVVVARLVPDKRVAEALCAARLVPNLRAAVIGDGPELAELRRRFPNARFLGRLPRTEALTWIAAADVLVSASRHEGAPTAIREARALGVAVAARPAGDIARWAELDAGLVLVPGTSKEGQTRRD